MFKKGFLAFHWATTREEISNLRRNGKIIRGKNVNLRIITEKRAVESLHPEISIISTRGFKNAVSRNLAKRRIIGCIMENRELLDVHCSYLFECKKGTEKENYQKLVVEINKLLRESI